MSEPINQSIKSNVHVRTRACHVSFLGTDASLRRAEGGQRHIIFYTEATEHLRDFQVGTFAARTKTLLDLFGFPNGTINRIESPEWSSR